MSLLSEKKIAIVEGEIPCPVKWRRGGLPHIPIDCNYTIIFCTEKVFWHKGSVKTFANFSLK
jgi:hypothetical protein